MLDQVIKNSTNPTFVTPTEDHKGANPTLATSNADQERATNNNDDNEDPGIPTTNTTVPPPTKYSQKMKDLELWHQRLGHSSTPYNKSILQMPILRKGQDDEKGR